MNNTTRLLHSRKSMRVYEDREIEPAAKQAILEAAESLGIGTCYIEDITENFETHRQLLNLPQYVVPTCMVCFSYPTAQQLHCPKPICFQTADIVCENGYCPEKAVHMEQMLMERQEVPGSAELEAWIQRFCARKWNCAFSEEMSRSCRAMLDC